MNFQQLILELDKKFPEHLKIYRITNNQLKVITNLKELPTKTISLTDDSRNIQSNTFFFSTYYAKPFLHHAIQQSPFAIFITQKEFETLLKKSEFLKNQLYCITGKKKPDFYLSHISSLYYKEPSKEMTIITVTGTNGKTSITFMIYHLWKKKNIPCAQIGTLGVYYWNGKEEIHFQTGFTTPRSYELQKILYELKQKHIFHVAMEVSSEALALHRIEGLYIQKAIFTNLGYDHLNFHKNRNSYLFSKLHLFFLTIRTTQESYPFIVVYDTNLYNIFRRFSRLTNTTIIYLLQSHLNHNFIKKQPLPFLFNQLNALCAYYGVNTGNTLYHLTETPLEDLTNIPGRMEKFSFCQQIDIFIDYAHTPDALENVLFSLKELYPIIITVVGCGGDRDKEKRPLMGKIASQFSDYIIITDDNPRTEDPANIRKEIIFGILPNKKKTTSEIPDRKHAIQEAIHFAYQLHKEKKGQKIALLIAGKGHETYQILGKKKHYFSDQEVVLETIQNYHYENKKNTIR